MKKFKYIVPLKKSKMRCFKLLAALLAVLLFLSACAGIGTTKNVETVGETHIGTQGIYFDFLPNYPPPIIYLSGQDTGTNIVLDVKNLGSFTTSVYFFLSGFDPSIVKLSEATHVIGTIEGKSPTNPEGGYAQVQFPTYGTLNVNMPKNIDVYPMTIQATACYDYETKASIPVCVDPNPYSPITQKACIPHGAAVAGGQGAPVAITSVEQESLKGKTIFKIHISNTGGGQVYEKGNTQLCTKLPYDKFNKITYSPFKLGGAAGQCTPASPIRLSTGGTALITCVFNVAGDLAYTTTLDADLMYGYMFSRQRSVQIKKI